MPERTHPPKNPDPRANRLLARLEQRDFDAVMRNARMVSLKFRKRLLRQDEPVNCVYFPLTCMISVLVTDGDKAQMEMATIGKEGVVGASEAFQRQGAIGLNIIQIPGAAALRQVRSGRWRTRSRSCND